MPRATPFLTSFASGELSPLLLGRSDLAKYQSGAQRVRNMLVLPQGPLMRRRGTKYLFAGYSNTYKSRLVPFVFSRTDRFVLEFTQNLIRFIKDGVLIWSLATPYSDIEVFDLAYAQQGDVLIITHRSHKPRKLSRITDTSWTLVEMEFQDGPYLDANEDEGIQITATLTTDTIELKGPSGTFNVGHVGQTVEFKEGSKWRLGNITEFVDSSTVKISGNQIYDRVLDLPDTTFVDRSGATNVDTTPPGFGAYHIGNYIRETETMKGGAPVPYWCLLNGNGVPTSTTYAATDVTYINLGDISKGERVIVATLTANEDLFVSTDVGRHVRMNFDGAWTWGKILTYASARVVSAQFYAAFPRDSRDVTKFAGNGTTSLFRLGAWSATTGWPGTVTFFEQRAVYAATALQPQTLWFSVTDDYENHQPTELDSTVVDSGGVTYTIAASEINTIQWLVSGQTLLVGTAAAEYQARAASTVNEPITARNLVVQRQTSVGSLPYQRPAFINSATLFIGASSNSLHEMSYNFEKDSFVSKDMTIFADHILRDGGGAEEVVYQEDPSKTLWLRLANGTLAACAYVRDQEVIAWSVHTISSGAVESMCLIPDGTRGEREVLYLVIRTAGGTRQIEVLDVDFPIASIELDWLSKPFVDSYKVVNGTTGVLAGLSHLEGREVAIVDYDFQTTATVVGGQVDVSPTVLSATVIVGLKYTAELKSVPLETGSVTGSGRGHTGRIDEVGVVLHRSVNFYYYDSDRYKVKHSPNSTLTLFTGTTKVHMFNSYELDQVVELVVEDPYPFYLVGLAIDHKTNEQ